MLRSIAGRLGLLGRSSRTTLVHFLILYFVGAVILWFGQLILLKEDPRRFALLLPWLSWIVPALSLVFLWLSIRRFNDQDRPGWIALIAAGLGIVIVPTGFGISVMALFLPVPPAVALLFMVGYLVALCLPGTIGPNRYGPDPRGFKSREHYIEHLKSIGRR